ncbi:MAG: SulP family inorganic anion transporter [Actinomycetota bacterium]|nr:SulP family inorganic anion transporter [Actinomycetota bacterium]MDH4352372.1 SulP family inorganic anion transporter [Actinomycetota bacterium]
MASLPGPLRGYQASWFRGDLVAGVTLAAVAIPEVMGYTSIAQTPIVTGLYTIILPTAVFALIGSSRLLVVGADSATAAVMAAGLTGLSVSGLVPNSKEWVAWASLVALVCGGLLLVARLLKLGFIGDFLSTSVLVGFLTGVGIQVLTGQIPDMLGVPKSSGNWFQQQWGTITSIPDANLPTVAFAVGTIAIIVGFKRFLPKVPGAVIAVIASITVSTALDVTADGVAVIGKVKGGFPPIGLPSGITWSDAYQVLGIAVSCAVLIIAQSAATSRSFAMKHGERVDVNRDILGLSGASVAAGLSGTFVVNGSPTKTQILNEDGGHTQVANLVMASVTLVILLFATGLLTNMPTSVLAAIVFLIGVDLIDMVGLRTILAKRRSEFVIASITAVVVFTIGVEQGIVLAIVASILEIIRRQYKPADFVVGVDQEGQRTYTAAQPGIQSAPGLLVFRYDADLFYANANRFSDEVQKLFTTAPDTVRWLVLDCSGISDVDYSAGIVVNELVDFVHARDAVFSLAGVDSKISGDLTHYGTIDKLDPSHVYPSVTEAIDAFRRETSPTG